MSTDIAVDIFAHKDRLTSNEEAAYGAQVKAMRILTLSFLTIVYLDVLVPAETWRLPMRTLTNSHVPQPK